MNEIGKGGVALPTRCWPGALITQQTLRPKSKEASFRTVFWITVLINCGALAWLHTESGQETVRRLIV